LSLQQSKFVSQAQQLTTKLIQEKRRNNNHHQVTKMAAALFRAANGIPVKVEQRDTEPEKEAICASPDIDSPQSPLPVTVSI